MRFCSWTNLFLLGITCLCLTNGMPNKQHVRNKKNLIDNTVKMADHGKTLVKKSAHPMKIKDVSKKSTGGGSDIANSDDTFDRAADGTDNSLYGRQEKEQGTENSGVGKFEGPPCRWGCGKREAGIDGPPGRWGGRKRGMRRVGPPGRWGGRKRGELPGRWGGKKRGELPGRWGGKKRSELPGHWGGKKRSELPGHWGGKKRSEIPGRWGGKKRSEIPGRWGGKNRSELPLGWSQKEGNQRPPSKET
uniref:Pp7 n=1 Tax=Clytia hemisphaerica TaxID=252671 RepID=A0A1W6LRY1_9CNID|nr:pp7 precursor [Clytia hemisphaerica]